MRLLIVATALLGIFTTSAFAGEKSIAVSALPQPIQAAIAAGYPGATVIEASSEVEGGATTYEAGIKLGDRSLDLAFSADGKQLEEEEVVAIASTPAAVQATVAARTGWEVKRVERAAANGVTTYEVLLQQGKKRIVLMLDPAGTVKDTEQSSHAEDE